MNGLGTTELLVIFIFILILFGPEKLPEFARKLGAYYRKLNEYKRYLDEEIRRGYLEAGFSNKNEDSKLRFKRVEPSDKDELYRELVETARSLGIDTEGKDKVELARAIREKLSMERGAEEK